MMSERKPPSHPCELRGGDPELPFTMAAEILFLIEMLEKAPTG
jgi:hypothetical protein